MDNVDLDTLKYARKGAYYWWMEAAQDYMSDPTNERKLKQVKTTWEKFIEYDEAVQKQINIELDVKEHARLEKKFWQATNG